MELRGRWGEEEGGCPSLRGRQRLGFVIKLSGNRWGEVEESWAPCGAPPTRGHQRTSGTAKWTPVIRAALARMKALRPGRKE